MAGSRVQLGSLLLLGAWGCGAEPVTLTLPPLPDAESLLLVSTGDGDRLTLATNLDDLSVLRFEVPADWPDDRALHLLGFECPLDRLGLVAGRDVPRPEVRRAVPIPRHRYVMEPSWDDPNARWSEAEALPADVLAAAPLAFAAPRPCVSFDREIRRVRPEPTVLYRPAALPNGEVLLSTDAALFVVGPSGLREVPLAEGMPERIAFVDEDGEVWLNSHAGALARGHPDRGFELFPEAQFVPVPVPGQPVLSLRLAGSVSSGEPELFATVLTHSSSAEPRGAVNLHWWHDGRWDTLLEGAVADYGGSPVVKWLSPGRALFGTPAIAGATVAQDGVLSHHALPGQAGDRPNVLISHPELDIVVGTRQGAIIAGEPRGWETLRPVEFGLTAVPIVALVQLDEGLLFANARNELIQWFEDDPDCRPLRALLDGVHGNTQTARWRDGIIVAPHFEAGRADEARSGEYHVLTRVPRDPCVIDDGARGAGWDL